MDQIIKLNTQYLNNTKAQTVDAEDLYKFLDVKSKFADWIVRRINKYGFTEGDDFICISQKKETQRSDGQTGVTILKTYHMTLDMAKELSMVENNEQGRLARRYFIECEKKLKEIKQEPPRPVELPPQAGSFKDKFDVIKALVDNTSLSPVAKETLLLTTVEENLGIRIPYRPVIERKAYSAKEIGDKLGISANMVGRIANDHGLKTEEFGRRVLSKSMYSPKQVEQFLYYEEVIPVIKNILEEN